MKKKELGSALIQIFALAVGAALCLPLIYAVFISFMREPEIISTKLHFLPERWSFDNYEAVIKSQNLLRYMFNSLFVALISSFSRVVERTFYLQWYLQA